MENDRIQALRRLVERSPEDARLRFGLAAEYEKLERWEEVVSELERYLSLAEDEGNAWGRLGHALSVLGREDEARQAYRKGIDAARSHGHPTMAAEFEETLEELGG